MGQKTQKKKEKTIQTKHKTPRKKYYLPETPVIHKNDSKIKQERKSNTMQNHNKKMARKQAHYFVAENCQKSLKKTITKTQNTRLLYYQSYIPSK